MSKGNGKFVIGTLLGAAAGAVAGILFAPKSGKETRKELGDKAKNLAKEAKDMAIKEGQEVQKAAEKVIDKIKEQK